MRTKSTHTQCFALFLITTEFTINVIFFCLNNIISARSKMINIECYEVDCKSANCIELYTENP